MYANHMGTFCATLCIGGIRPDTFALRVAGSRRTGGCWGASAAMGAHGRYHLLSMYELTELCLALGCDPKETAAMSKLALVSALRMKLTLSRQQRSACTPEHGCNDPEVKRSSPLPASQSESPRFPRTTGAGRHHQARNGPELRQQHTPHKTAGPRGATFQRRRPRPPSVLTADTLEEMEQRCRRELCVEQEHRRTAFHPEAGLTDHFWAGLHDTATTEEQLRRRAYGHPYCCAIVLLASFPPTVTIAWTCLLCTGDCLEQSRRAC
eukprot:COSAG02_NODE_185_length_30442_cov_59.370168_14_plen_266_part_00